MFSFFLSCSFVVVVVVVVVVDVVVVVVLGEEGMGALLCSFPNID